MDKSLTQQKRQEIKLFSSGPYHGWPCAQTPTCWDEINEVKLNINNRMLRCISYNINLWNMYVLQINCSLINLSKRFFLSFLFKRFIISVTFLHSVKLRPRFMCLIGPSLWGSIIRVYPNYITTKVPISP